MKKIIISLCLALLSTASLAARNTNFITTDAVNIADGINSQISLCGIIVDEQPKFYITATLVNATIPAPAGVMCKYATAALALGAHSIRMTFATGLPGINAIEGPESAPTLNFIITDTAPPPALPAPQNLGAHAQ